MTTSTDIEMRSILKMSFWDEMMFTKKKTQLRNNIQNLQKQQQEKKN